MAACDISVLPMAFCVVLFARPRLVFSWRWISSELPRAPIEPRVMSICSRALARLAIAEAAASFIAFAAPGPVTGVSSAARSWLRVSSTFWFWWVLEVTANWSPASGEPDTW
ncbi:hypothetical protein D9M71_796140 [compost metagenome]